MFMKIIIKLRNKIYHGMKKNWPLKSTWQKLIDFTIMERPARFNHPSHQVIIGVLLRVMKRNKFSFLDCGVLSAVTVRKLIRTSLNVTYCGIDISNSVIDNCKKRFPQITWQAMDVQNLKFEDETFDVVLVRHVLEHLPYYDKAIREVRRVARKYVLLCLFNPLREVDILKQQTKYGGLYHCNVYGRDDFLTCLNGQFSSVEEIYIKDLQRDNQLFICTV
ncbi:MAG: class I SAM-dependent methyltransferase [Candidatus Omnitrophica bacterium]|nr:class I SAM-dependent methyltransferase [Candidatus Omnitrophota bacterium]